MKRILIVEDHAAFSEALSYVLEEEPDLEVVAQAGSLAEVRRHGISDGFDVAVVDLALPDGNGMDLIPELREANPDLCVLVLTASPNPATHARAREAGAQEVLNKGTRLSKIVAAVKHLGSERINIP